MPSPLSPQNKSRQAELQRVNQQIALYIIKTINEQQRIEHLSQTIAGNEAKLFFSKQSQSPLGTVKSTANMNTQISTMENQLNQLMITFNTRVMGNKQLRLSIDDLRQERVCFDEIYTKLEYEVQANAHKMTRVLEEGKKRIKMRDKALSEVEVLEKQLHEVNESLLFCQDELANNDFDERDRVCQLVDSEKDKFKSATTESRKFERKQMNNANEEDDENLDEALAKVKELTGIVDANSLIKKMSQIDELNHSRFNYIAQELEVKDMLDYQIAEAKQELEMACLDSTLQKQQEAATNREKEHMTKTQLEAVEEKHNQKLEIWEKIIDSIQSACAVLEEP